MLVPNGEPYLEKWCSFYPVQMGTWQWVQSCPVQMEVERCAFVYHFYEISLVTFHIVIVSRHNT